MSHRFPFGASVQPCPPTKPASGPADVFVLGVYPSALHVDWSSPAEQGVRIRNLAVDNEPSVFWDGGGAAALVEAWREQWFDPAWGSVEPAPNNGSSGTKVDDDVLAPLGIARSNVWTTDVVNEYFLKVDGQQGKALAGRFLPFADAVSLPADRRPDLANRPRPMALVEQGLAAHRSRLLAEVAESKAPLVVTLGNEALWALTALADEHALPDRLDKSGAGYGRRCSATLGGRTLEVIPLKHPGQQGDAWRATHDAWAASI